MSQGYGCAGENLTPDAVASIPLKNSQNSVQSPPNDRCQGKGKTVERVVTTDRKALPGGLTATRRRPEAVEISRTWALVVLMIVDASAGSIVNTKTIAV